MNKLCALIVLTFSAWILGDATDNEIFLEQSGDTLTLTIDQVGYGNKFCGTISSGACASDMMITGSNITFNVDQIGNSMQKVQRLEFPNCGHLIPLEKPYDFAIHLNQFAKKLR